MLQPSITVRQGEDSRIVDGEQMIEVLREMHAPQQRQLEPNACQVLRWSLRDRTHQDGWHKVLATLGASDVQPVCSTAQR